MRKIVFILLPLLLIAVSCTPGEKADELKALQSAPKEAPAQAAMDLEALKNCCDERAREMGAECCAQLDEFMRAHAGMPGAPAGEMPGMRTGRPVEVPPEIAAQWPQVRLRVGLKGEQEKEVTVNVGEKIKPEGSPLEIEVLAFLPAFKMTDGAIVSDGNQPANPAAKVIIREEGKPDWTGWLFANMPDVHAFPHEIWRVILLAGVKKE